MAEIKVIGLLFNLVGAIFLVAAIPFRIKEGRVEVLITKYWWKIGWYGGLSLLVIGFIFQLIGEWWG